MQSVIFDLNKKLCAWLIWLKVPNIKLTKIRPVIPEMFHKDKHNSVRETQFAPKE